MLKLGDYSIIYIYHTYIFILAIIGYYGLVDETVCCYGKFIFTKTSEI